MSNAVAQLTAVELADVLVAVILERHALAIVLEPAAGGHTVWLEQATGSHPILEIPAPLGDAVAARLGLLAKLDLTSAQQIGRTRVALGSREADVLVELRTGAGQYAEVRRVASLHGAELPGKPDERISAYRVLEEVGRGGMGVVYRGVHEALARPVAIKVLYATYAHDPEISARFVREARAASRSRHPGIVEVYDFGLLPDGRAFLVMELIEDKTLEAHIEAGPIEPGRALLIARGIAAALGAAHAAGVIHRDLKPANVFVDEADGVKLADFGAAKFVPGTGPAGPGETQPGSVFGTPYYMSPEHARGKSTDTRTDLYALGCVLFEMLTGRVPFDGDTTIDVLTKHIRNPVPKMEGPRGPIPEVLAQIVRRAMAKRAGARYQTANEMIADLERAAVAMGRTGWRRWLPV